MKHRYAVRRDTYIYFDIIGESEEDIEERYEEMCDNGELNDLWRNAVLEETSEVAWVDEMRDGEWVTIYNANIR